MKPLTRSTLHGTWATVLLPLDENEAIRWSDLHQQLQLFAKAGVDGIYMNGTAGEFYTQSEEEFLQLAKSLSSFCESQAIPYQIGASHAHAAGTLHRIELTRYLEPGAFQIILPEWNPLSWDELQRFIDRCAAAAAPTPLIIYNPPNANKVLTPEEWNTLTEAHPSVIGIKVLGGDADWHQAMKPVAERISVFVAGIHLASGIIQGCGRGSYSNLACLSPKGAVGWAEQIRTNPEQALEHEKVIRAVFETAAAPLRGVYGNSALDKAWASAGDWAPITPRVRWPMTSVPEEEIKRLSKLFKTELPFLFSES